MPIQPGVENDKLGEGAKKRLNESEKNTFDAVYTNLKVNKRAVAPYPDNDWFHVPADPVPTQPDAAEPAGTADANRAAAVDNGAGVFGSAIGSVGYSAGNLFPGAQTTQSFTPEQMQTLRLRRPAAAGKGFDTLEPVVARERRELALQRAAQQREDVAYANELLQETTAVGIADYLCNLSVDLAMRSEELLTEECDAFGATRTTLPAFGFRDEALRQEDVPKSYRTRVRLSEDDELCLSLQTIDDVMVWMSADGERLRRMLSVLAAQKSRMNLKTYEELDLFRKFEAPLRLDSVTYVVLATGVSVPLGDLRQLLQQGLRTDLVGSIDVVGPGELELDFAYDFETRLLAVPRFAKALSPVSLKLHSITPISGIMQEHLVMERLRDSIGCPLVKDALPSIEYKRPTMSGFIHKTSGLQFAHTTELGCQALLEACWSLRHRLLCWADASTNKPLYRSTHDVLMKCTRLLDVHSRSTREHNDTISQGVALQEIDPMRTLLEQAVVHASMAVRSLDINNLPQRVIEMEDEALAHMELFFGLLASVDYALGQGCGVSSRRGELALVVPVIQAAGLPLAAAIVKGPRRLPLKELTEIMMQRATLENELADRPLSIGDLERANNVEMAKRQRRAGIATELAMRFVDAEHACEKAYSRPAASPRADLLNQDVEFDWIGSRMNVFDVLASTSARALQASQELWDAGRVCASKEQASVSLDDPMTHTTTNHPRPTKSAVPLNTAHRRSDPMATALADDKGFKLGESPESLRCHFLATAVGSDMKTTPVTLLQRALKSLVAFGLQLTSMRSHLHGYSKAHDGWQLRESVERSSVETSREAYVDHLLTLLMRSGDIFKTLIRLTAQLQTVYTQSLRLWRMSAQERAVTLDNAARQAIEGAAFLAQVSACFQTVDTHLSAPEWDPTLGQFAMLADLGFVLYKEPRLLRLEDVVPYRPGHNHRYGVNIDRMIIRKKNPVNTPTKPTYWTKRQAYMHGLHTARIFLSYAATHFLTPIEGMEMKRRHLFLFEHYEEYAPPKTADYLNENGPGGAIQIMSESFVSLLVGVINSCTTDDAGLFETNLHGLVLRTLDHIGCLSMDDAHLLQATSAVERARKQAWSLVAQVQVGDGLVQHLEYERLFPPSTSEFLEKTLLPTVDSEDLLRLARSAGALVVLLVASTDFLMPSTVDALMMRPQARKRAICEVVCSMPSVQDSKRVLTDPSLLLRNGSASYDFSYAPLLSTNVPTPVKQRAETDADGLPVRLDELQAGMAQARVFNPHNDREVVLDADEAIQQALTHCKTYHQTHHQSTNQSTDRFNLMPPITDFVVIGCYQFTQKADDDEELEDDSNTLSELRPILDEFEELRDDLQMQVALSDVVLIQECPHVETLPSFAPDPLFQMTKAQRDTLRLNGFVSCDSFDHRRWCVVVSRLDELQLQPVMQSHLIVASAFSPTVSRSVRNPLAFVDDPIQAQVSAMATLQPVLELVPRFGNDLCSDVLTIQRTASSARTFVEDVNEQWTQAVPTSLWAARILASVQARRINAMVDNVYSRASMSQVWMRAQNTQQALVIFVHSYLREHKERAIDKYDAPVVLLVHALSLLLFGESLDPNPPEVLLPRAKSRPSLERQRSEDSSSKTVEPVSPPPALFNVFGPCDNPFFKGRTPTYCLDELTRGASVNSPAYQSSCAISAIPMQPHQIGVQPDVLDFLNQTTRNTGRIVALGLVLASMETPISLPPYVFDSLLSGFLMQTVLKFLVAKARAEIAQKALPDQNPLDLYGVSRFPFNAPDPVQLEEDLREKVASKLLRPALLALPVSACCLLTIIEVMKDESKDLDDLMLNFTNRAMMVGTLFYQMVNDELHVDAFAPTVSSRRQMNLMDWAYTGLRNGMQFVPSKRLSMAFLKSKELNSEQKRTAVLSAMQVSHTWLVRCVFLANAATIMISANEHRTGISRVISKVAENAFQTAIMATLWTAGSEYFSGTSRREILSTGPDKLSSEAGPHQTALQNIMMDSGRTAWLSTVCSGLFFQPLQSVIWVDQEDAPYGNAIPFLEGVFVGVVEIVMASLLPEMLVSSGEITANSVPLAMGLLSLAAPGAAAGALVAQLVHPTLAAPSSTETTLSTRVGLPNIVWTMLSTAAAGLVSEAVDEVTTMHLSSWSGHLLQQAGNSAAAIAMMTLQMHISKVETDAPFTSASFETTRSSDPFLPTDTGALLAASATFTMATQLLARRRHTRRSERNEFAKLHVQILLRGLVLATTLYWSYYESTLVSDEFKSTLYNTSETVGTMPTILDPPSSDSSKRAATQSKKIANALQGLHAQYGTMLQLTNATDARLAKPLPTHYHSRIPSEESSWRSKRPQRLDATTMKQPTSADDEPSFNAVMIGNKAAAPASSSANPPPAQSQNTKALDLVALCNPTTALQTLQVGLNHIPVSSALWATQVSVVATKTQTFDEWFERMSIKPKVYKEDDKTPAEQRDILTFYSVDGVIRAQETLNEVGLGLVKVEPSKSNRNVKCRLVNLYQACHGTKYGLLHHSLKNIDTIANNSENYSQLRKLVFQECERAQSANGSEDVIKNKIKIAVEKINTGLLIDNYKIKMIELNTVLGEPPHSGSYLPIAAALPELSPGDALRRSMQPHILHDLIYGAAWAYREALSHADLRLLPCLPEDDLLSGNRMRLNARKQLIQEVTKDGLTVDDNSGSTNGVDPLTDRVVALARLARAAAAADVLYETLSVPHNGHNVDLQGKLNITFNGQLLDEKDALSNLMTKCTHLFKMDIKKSEIKTTIDVSTTVKPLINAVQAQQFQPEDGPRSALMKSDTPLYRDSTSSLQAGNEMLLASQTQYRLDAQDNTSFNTWSNNIQPSSQRQFLLRNAYANGTNVATDKAWAQVDDDLVSAAHLRNSGGSYAHTVLAHSLQGVAMAYTIQQQQQPSESIDNIGSETAKIPSFEYQTMVRLLATRPLDRGKVETDLLRSLLATLQTTPGGYSHVLRWLQTGGYFTKSNLTALFVYVARLLMFFLDTRSTRYALHGLERRIVSYEDPFQRFVSPGMTLLANGMMQLAWMRSQPDLQWTQIASFVILLGDASRLVFEQMGMNRSSSAMVESMQMAHLTMLSRWFTDSQPLLTTIYAQMRSTVGALVRRPAQILTLYSTKLPYIGKFAGVLKQVPTNGLALAYTAFFVYALVMWRYQYNLNPGSLLTRDQNLKDLQSFLYLFVSEIENPMSILGGGESTIALMEKLSMMDVFAVETTTVTSAVLGLVTLIKTPLVTVVNSFFPDSATQILTTVFGNLTLSAPSLLSPSSPLDELADTTLTSPQPRRVVVSNSMSHVHSSVQTSSGPAAGSSTRINPDQFRFLFHQVVFGKNREELKKTLMGFLIKNDPDELRSLQANTGDRLDVLKMELTRLRTSAKREMRDSFVAMQKLLSDFEQGLDTHKKLQAVLERQQRNPGQTVVSREITQASTKVPVCDDDTPLGEYEKALIKNVDGMLEKMENAVKELTRGVSSDQRAELLNYLVGTPSLAGFPADVQTVLKQASQSASNADLAKQTLVVGSLSTQLHAAYTRQYPPTPQEMGALENVKTYEQQAMNGMNPEKMQRILAVFNKRPSHDEIKNSRLDAAYSDFYRRENVAFANRAATVLTLSKAWRSQDTLPEALKGHDYDGHSVLELPFFIEFAGESEKRQVFLPMLHPQTGMLQPEGVLIESINLLLSTFDIPESTLQTFNEDINKFLSTDKKPVEISIEDLETMHKTFASVLPNNSSAKERLTDNLKHSFLLAAYAEQKKPKGVNVFEESIPKSALVGEVVSSLVQTLLCLGDLNSAQRTRLQTALMVAFPHEPFFNEVVEEWLETHSTQSLQLQRTPSSSAMRTLLQPRNDDMKNYIYQSRFNGYLKDFVALDASYVESVSSAQIETSSNIPTLFSSKDEKGSERLVLPMSTFGRILSAAVTQSAVRAGINTQATSNAAHSEPSTSSGAVEFLSPRERQQRKKEAVDFLATCFESTLYQGWTPNSQVSSKQKASSDAATSADTNDAGDTGDRARHDLASKVVLSLATIMQDTSSNSKESKSSGLSPVLTACGAFNARIGRELYRFGDETKVATKNGYADVDGVSIFQYTAAVRDQTSSSSTSTSTTHLQVQAFLIPQSIETLQKTADTLLQKFKDVSEEQAVRSFQEALGMVVDGVNRDFELLKNTSISFKRTKLPETVNETTSGIGTLVMNERSAFRTAAASKMNALLKAKPELYKAQQTQIELFKDYWSNRLYRIQQGTDKVANKDEEIESLNHMLRVATDLIVWMNLIKNGDFDWKSSLDQMDPHDHELLYKNVYTSWPGVPDLTNDELLRMVKSRNQRKSTIPTIPTVPSDFESALASYIGSVDDRQGVWTETDPTALLLMKGLGEGALMSMTRLGRSHLSRARTQLVPMLAAPALSLLMQYMNMLTFSMVLVSQDRTTVSGVVSHSSFPFIVMGIAALGPLLVAPASHGQGALTVNADGNEYSRLAKHVAFDELINWVSTRPQPRNGVLLAGDPIDKSNGKKLPLLNNERLGSIFRQLDMHTGELSFSECLQIEAVYEAAALAMRARMVRLVDRRFLGNVKFSVSNPTATFAIDSIPTNDLLQCVNKYGLLLHGLFANRQGESGLLTEAYPGYRNTESNPATVTLYQKTLPYPTIGSATIQEYVIDLSVTSKSFVVDALLKSIIHSRKLDGGDPKPFDSTDRFGRFPLKPNGDKALESKDSLNKQLGTLLYESLKNCTLLPSENSQSSTMLAPNGNQPSGYELSEVQRSALGDLFDTTIDNGKLERTGALHQKAVDEAVNLNQRQLNVAETHVRKSIALVTHPLVDVAYDVKSTTDFDTQLPPVAQVARARMRKDIANGLYGLRQVHFAMLMSSNGLSATLRPLTNLTKEVLASEERKVDAQAIQQRFGERIRCLRSTYATQAARLYGRIFVLRNAEAKMGSNAPGDRTTKSSLIESGHRMIETTENVGNDASFIGYAKRFKTEHHSYIQTGQTGWSWLGWMPLTTSAFKIPTEYDGAFAVLDLLDEGKIEEAQTLLTSLKTFLYGSVNNKTALLRILPAYKNATLDTPEENFMLYPVLLHDVNVLLPSSVWTTASSTP